MELGIIEVPRHVNTQFLSVPLVFFAFASRLSRRRTALRRAILVTPRGVLYVAEAGGGTTRTVLLRELAKVHYDASTHAVVLDVPSDRHLFLTFAPNGDSDSHPKCTAAFFVDVVLHFAECPLVRQGDLLSLPLRLDPGAAAAGPTPIAGLQRAVDRARHEPPPPPPATDAAAHGGPTASARLEQSLRAPAEERAAQLSGIDGPPPGFTFEPDIAAAVELPFTAAGRTVGLKPPAPRAAPASADHLALMSFFFAEAVLPATPLPVGAAPLPAPAPASLLFTVAATGQCNVWAGSDTLWTFDAALVAGVVVQDSFEAVLRMTLPGHAAPTLWTVQFPPAPEPRAGKRANDLVRALLRFNPRLAASVAAPPPCAAAPAPPEPMRVPTVPSPQRPPRAPAVYPAELPAVALPNPGAAVARPEPEPTRPLFPEDEFNANKARAEIEPEVYTRLCVLIGLVCQSRVQTAAGVY